MLSQLDKLQLICKEWAGHAVLDSYKTKDDATALIHAANGREASLRLLIAAKADLTARTNDGLTALHLAASINNASICRVLVDEGASLTATNNDGQTPYEMAKNSSKAEAVAVLEAPTAACIAAAEVRAVATVASMATRFRFPVTKAADAKMRWRLERQFYKAAEANELARLLELCQEWAGHRIVNEKWVSLLV